jgi:hypothetical protein
MDLREVGLAPAVLQQLKTGRRPADASPEFREGEAAGAACVPEALTKQSKIKPRGLRKRRSFFAL